MITRIFQTPLKSLPGIALSITSAKNQKTEDICEFIVGQDIDIATDIFLQDERTYNLGRLIKDESSKWRFDGNYEFTDIQLRELIEIIEAQFKVRS